MDATKTTLDKILMHKIRGGNTSNIKQAIFSAYSSGLEGEDLSRSIDQTLTDAGLDNSSGQSELPLMVVAILIK